MVNYVDADHPPGVLHNPRDLVVLLARFRISCEGWLWAMTIELAFLNTAVLKISRGWTRNDENRDRHLFDKSISITYKAETSFPRRSRLEIGQKIWRPKAKNSANGNFR